MTTETTPDPDDGPECETCGKTSCPDADLPGFSEPRSCAYASVYEALRYDRCEYGCGRDITNETIRRDVVPAVERIIAARVAAVAGQVSRAIERRRGEHWQDHLRIHPHAKGRSDPGCYAAHDAYLDAANIVLSLEQQP